VPPRNSLDERIGVLHPRNAPMATTILDAFFSFSPHVLHDGRDLGGGYVHSACLTYELGLSVMLFVDIELGDV
jgi:hypothetical protein